MLAFFDIYLPYAYPLYFDTWLGQMSLVSGGDGFLRQLMLGFLCKRNNLIPSSFTQCRRLPIKSYFQFQQRARMASKTIAVLNEGDLADGQTYVHWWLPARRSNLPVQPLENTACAVILQLRLPKGFKLLTLPS
jgi:hypothetical protein